MPGTITVSARLKDESRHGTLKVTCSDFTSGATLQIRTSYNGRPSRPRTSPNISHGVDKSPSTTPSNATTATRCRRLPGHVSGLA